MLKESINLDKYKNNHPAGNIGIKVKKIKDELIKEFPKKVISDAGISLNDILLDMTKYSIGYSYNTNIQLNKKIGISSI